MNKGNFKGNRVGYHGIHRWLRKNFGNACRCENENCSGTSNTFHWALKKGFKYERKKENFWQLCSSCHKKYDMTEIARLKMSISQKGNGNRKGKLASQETRKKISIGTRIGMAKVGYKVNL